MQQSFEVINESWGNTQEEKGCRMRSRNEVLINDNHSIYSLYYSIREESYNPRKRDATVGIWPGYSN